MAFDKKAYQKAYQEKNKTEHRQRSKANYEANKEKYNAARKARYAENKEVEQAQSKAYHLLHKDIRAKKARTDEGRFNRAKVGAKERGLAWELTFEQWQVLSKQPCNYCGGELSETGYGLDRKNQECYYRLDSVVPCCKRCNQTFMAHYTYEEKMILSPSLREIERRRQASLIQT